MADLVLSLDELRDALGIGAPAIRRAIAEGRMPHVKFGDRVVVPVTALRDWLDEEAWRSVGRTTADPLPFKRDLRTRSGRALDR